MSDAGTPLPVRQYAITEKQDARLQNDFTYHAPFGCQATRYTLIRNYAKSFAEFLMRNCPESRELSVALTNLDQVVFNANAAIARNEKP